MRIVGGKYRGKKLLTPKSDDTRPTTDRVRESLFNILEHRKDVRLMGARVLDVFAGTGAMGLEALSRGAGFVTFIEMARDAQTVLQQNVRSMSAARETDVLKQDARQIGDIGNRTPYNLVFMDPPYRKGLADVAMEQLANGGWFQEGAVIVVEEEKGVEISAPDGFQLLDNRSYGRTQIFFLKFDGRII